MKFRYDSYSYYSTLLDRHQHQQRVNRGLETSIVRIQHISTKNALRMRWKVLSVCVSHFDRERARMRAKKKECNLFKSTWLILPHLTWFLCHFFFSLVVAFNDTMVFLCAFFFLVRFRKFQQFTSLNTSESGEIVVLRHLLEAKYFTLYYLYAAALCSQCQIYIVGFFFSFVHSLRTWLCWSLWLCLRCSSDNRWNKKKSGGFIEQKMALIK